MQKYKRQTVEISIIFDLVRNKINTPVIIKYPFWQHTEQNSKAILCLHQQGRGVLITEDCKEIDVYEGDIGEVLRKWKSDCFTGGKRIACLIAERDMVSFIEREQADD